MRRRFFLFLFLALLLIPLGVALVNDNSSLPSNDNTSSEEDVAREQTTLVFVGDMMFDRYIREHAERRGSYEHSINDFDEMFRDADGVVGNLEGSITGHDSMSVNAPLRSPESMTFTFDPAVASLLQEFNFVAVSLSNNHISNFGPSGVDATIEFLDETDVAYFGHPGGEDARTTTLELNGSTFSFVGFDQFSEATIDATLQAISRVSERSDWTIVYPHWGEEYETSPNPRKVERAHAFADAGADLVIGAHPHVIQTSEIYDGTPIYYSLGNFIFDQYFTEDVRCGLVITATFNTDGTIDTEESFSYLQEDGTTTKRACK